MEPDAALELLMDAKSKCLKPYNNDKMHELIEKTMYIKKEMEKIQKEVNDVRLTEELSKMYIFLKNTYDFYNRVRRSYNFSRIMKIQLEYSLYKCQTKYLNRKEIEHLHFFVSLLEEYKHNYPELEFEIEYIPLDHFVHFITLNYCGIVMDGDEMYELKANRYYFMKKNVIKHLLNGSQIKIL